MYYHDLDKTEIIEEIRLKEFDQVGLIGNKYYGGDQEWLSKYNYKSKFWSDRSCGITAAANTMLYITRKNGEEKISITDAEYSQLMLHIYDYIKPSIWGIPTVGKLAKGLRRFSSRNGFEVTVHKYRDGWDDDKVWSYLRKAIMEDFPVLMITWNTKIRNLKNHWVTVTGLVRTKSGKRYIITSNWGRRELFDLGQWVNEFSLNKGLVYFGKTQ